MNLEARRSRFWPQIYRKRGNRKHTDMAAAGGAEVALAPRLGMTIAGEAIHRRRRDELRRHTFGKCGMENSECAVSVPADGATAEVYT